MLRRPLSVIAACVAMLLFVALSQCVSDPSSGTILVDGGATVIEGSTPLYGVSGTVSGLATSDTVSLNLNNANAMSVGDGAFSFPPLLTQSQAYNVTVASVAKGYACNVANGSGTIATSDASGVAVQCVSSNAALSALTISAATLSPTFGATTLAYKANARISGIFPPQTTTTVTATALDPDAAITVNGGVTKSGVASAPIALKESANAIDVTVTAADGKTQSHYAITLSGYVSDYLKTSTSIPGAPAQFGYTVALSTDGNTLAVGAFNESSNASGVNGNQSDVSKSGAGAVYVFARASGMWSQQAYIKASNPSANAAFSTVALSSDGNTLAVGSPYESSNATGVNGNQNDTSAVSAGAAYVFTRAGTTWTQQAYIKASNARAGADFGGSISLSNDGNTLAVGSARESSDATGIDGNQNDTSMANAGAAYVFVRAGATWSQDAYVKASNTRAGAGFGVVALSGDASTLAVGSQSETSDATGINGDQTNGSTHSGAAYLFTHVGGTWTQQAYVKASNATLGFGGAIALSSDGTTFVGAAAGDSSGAKGINGDQDDTSMPGAGAVYVFTYAAGNWSQQAYIKASNPLQTASFGCAVAVSSDGNSLVSGALYEKSGALGINGNQLDTSTYGAGAAYVFQRTGASWSQLAYVKASNTEANLFFGGALAISGSGTTLAVGADDESSDATGVNGNQSDTSAQAAGAAYVF